MTNRILIMIVVLLLFSAGASARKKRAYSLFDAKGKPVSYEKMIRTAARNDILLFGELHNNPVAHWLQLELIKDLHGQKQLVLGAEMFEADNQQPLSDYVNGKIDAKALDTLARLWPNYKTDYAPLVNFARENRLPFAATNIPRRFANLVYKKGFGALDTLSSEEKSWMAPLPVPYDPELPGYKKMAGMMPGHAGENLPRAQAVKDAAMAHFILQHYQPGDFFVHFHGTYHTDFYEGILWYLRLTRPDLRYVTISTVSQADCSRLLDENRGKADFILCVDEDMTTTY